MKFLGSIVGVMFLAISVFAADREQFHVTKLTLGDPGVVITASGTELNIMDGVTATAAEINSAADASARMTTAAVTNGSTVTLSAATPVVVFTGSGQAAGFSNLVSIALPYPVGVEFLLTVSSASTNLIQFADSTTVLSLGALTTLDATDTLKIFTTATNKAVKVSTSDN
jgi:hypothetical protein